MKLSAALQWEAQREAPESWNKVYLNKDGKFWHTYLSVNSYLGVLSHYASYNIRRQLFLKERFLEKATYDNSISIFNKPYLLN